MTHEPEGGRRDGATYAQLKNDIDSGRTGDKVGGFDPGASPLGTDDEAAGVAASPAVIQQARAQERTGASNSARRNAATPELQPNARYRHPGMAVGIVIGVAAAAALAALLAAAL